MRDEKRAREPFEPAPDDPNFWPVLLSHVMGGSIRQLESAEKMVREAMAESSKAKEGTESGDVNAVCGVCGLTRGEHSREAFDYRALKENTANVAWRWGLEACPYGSQPFHPTNTFTEQTGQAQEAPKGDE
jgi:hypothetical protein